jgi:CheY-like chemotaxis protein/predicted regulator of Ras-like GTPase activity (Roadblock/LC7/MglB family)
MAKVLVVDDSLSVRKVVTRALGARRIDVLEAASGSVALELIERESPDLVVCDVIMPDQDGCEICAFVKGHPRLGATPVLLISGIVNDDVRARAMRAGADEVLLKPFAADDLLARVDRLLPASALAAAEPQPPSPPVAAGAPVPEAPAVSPAAAGSLLERFTAMEGVQWAVLADRDGFVLESTDGAANDTAIGAALAACLAETSQGLGRELGRGEVSSVILEFEKGTVIVWRVGASALLALGLSGSSVLGKVRYYARKVLPEVAQSL